MMKTKKRIPDVTAKLVGFWKFKKPWEHRRWMFRNKQNHGGGKEQSVEVEVKQRSKK